MEIEDDIRLAIVRNNKLYLYKGGLCKDCAFRGDCSNETICGALSVSGSFSKVGDILTLKVIKSDNDTQY